tara:strand:- start:501 stop:638 length:138 start_codon:yes stop_codon:yes gene_type:complete
MDAFMAKLRLRDKIRFPFKVWSDVGVDASFPDFQNRMRAEAKLFR